MAVHLVRERNAAGLRTCAALEDKKLGSRV